MDTLTTKEAAVLMKVSVRTIQLWADAGILKQWKTPGGHRRISKESVDELLSNKRYELLKDQLDYGRNESEGYLNVLVVEDDESLLKLYELKIESWRLPIRLYLENNGYDGLLRIGSSNIDILILDLQMDGINGFKLLDTLSNCDYINCDEIIVVSGLDEKEIRRYGKIPEGIRMYRKPIPFKEIKEIIIDKTNEFPLRKKPDM